MAGGLRDQWRAQAMRAIREAALDLFDARGFAAVKVEDVAAAAGVSASSVYRYFGTKEGLVVADEFDLMTTDDLEELFDLDDPVGSMVRAVQRYEGPDDGSGASVAVRRIRYFFEEPAVRRAVLASLDRAAQRIAPLLVSSSMTRTQANAAANAVAFGYFGALEQWHADGGRRPVSEYVEEGLQPLRQMWASAP